MLDKLPRRLIALQIAAIASDIKGSSKRINAMATSILDSSANTPHKFSGSVFATIYAIEGLLFDVDMAHDSGTESRLEKIQKQQRTKQVGICPQAREDMCNFEASWKFPGISNDEARLSNKRYKSLCLLPLLSSTIILTCLQI